MSNNSTWLTTPAAPPGARSLALTMTVTDLSGLMIWPSAGCVIWASGAGFADATVAPKIFSSAAVSVPPMEFPLELRSATLSVHGPAEVSPQWRTELKVQLE